jgi:hypothetical protein
MKYPITYFKSNSARCKPVYKRNFKIFVQWRKCIASKGTVTSSFDSSAPICNIMSVVNVFLLSLSVLEFSKFIGFDGNLTSGVNHGGYGELQSLTSSR